MQEGVTGAGGAAVYNGVRDGGRRSVWPSQGSKHVHVFVVTLQAVVMVTGECAMHSSGSQAAHLRLSKGTCSPSLTSSARRGTPSRLAAFLAATTRPRREHHRVRRTLLELNLPEILDISQHHADWAVWRQEWPPGWPVDD